MSFRYTTQRELRKAFWEAHPGLSRKRVTSFDGNHKDYHVDTRVAWVDWIDHLERDGQISEGLAFRATL